MYVCMYVCMYAHGSLVAVKAVQCLGSNTGRVLSSMTETQA